MLRFNRDCQSEPQTTCSPLWRGFICHSHYDGMRTWGYPESERASAAVRLARLKGRPQFISQEGGSAGTRAYLAAACPDGRFTFAALPYRNHTDAWTLRDIPARAALCAWLAEACAPYHQVTWSPRQNMEGTLKPAKR